MMLQPSLRFRASTRVHVPNKSNTIYFSLIRPIHQRSKAMMMTVALPTDPLASSGGRTARALSDAAVVASAADTAAVSPTRSTEDDEPEDEQSLPLPTPQPSLLNGAKRRSSLKHLFSSDKGATAATAGGTTKPQRRASLRADQTRDSFDVVLDQYSGAVLSESGDELEDRRDAVRRGMMYKPRAEVPLGDNILRSAADVVGGVGIVATEPESDDDGYGHYYVEEDNANDNESGETKDFHDSKSGDAEWMADLAGFVASQQNECRRNSTGIVPSLLHTETSQMPQMIQQDHMPQKRRSSMGAMGASMRSLFAVSRRNSNASNVSNASGRSLGTNDNGTNNNKPRRRATLSHAVKRDSFDATLGKFTDEERQYIRGGGLYRPRVEVDF